MSVDPILAIINKVRDEAGFDRLDSVNDEMELRKDLGLDSLELAVLTVKLEAKFEVDVFAKGFVQTVGELRSRIDERNDILD